MITILDNYTQVSFETVNDTHKFTGVCNIKENKIILIDVTVYEISKDYHLGTMSTGEGQGTTINIINGTDLTYLTQFAETLGNIKKELEEQLL